MTGGRKKAHLTVLKRAKSKSKDYIIDVLLYALGIARQDRCYALGIVLVRDGKLFVDYVMEGAADITTLIGALDKLKFDVQTDWRELEKEKGDV